jgi:very-short-patch-repair endonuclease
VFATNHLTHIDFLVFSRLTHQPVLAIEVDGFNYHRNPKQQERDKIKNGILEKYNIPILRFNTVGSGEKSKLISALTKINES